MLKTFVIVWHAFLGGDVNDGKLLQWLPHPFPTQEICYSFVSSAMQDYNRDKLISKNFWVDCIPFDPVKLQGLPTV